MKGFARITNNIRNNWGINAEIVCDGYYLSVIKETTTFILNEQFRLTSN